MRELIEKVRAGASARATLDEAIIPDKDALRRLLDQQRQARGRDPGAYRYNTEVNGNGVPIEAIEAGLDSLYAEGT